MSHTRLARLVGDRRWCVFDRRNAGVRKSIDFAAIRRCSLSTSIVNWRRGLLAAFFIVKQIPCLFYFRCLYFRRVTVWILVPQEELDEVFERLRSREPAKLRTTDWPPPPPNRPRENGDGPAVNGFFHDVDTRSPDRGECVRQCLVVVNVRKLKKTAFFSSRFSCLKMETAMIL